MGKTTHTLKSGQQVTLSDWEGLEPPQHGKALLSKPWDEDASRQGYSFYKSTEEYMRNEWAAANMHPTVAQLGSEKLLVFYHAQTKSWHTAEALDIDHKTQWKDHFKALGVANKAEAQMAYNDVGNLRLLPSAVNRARDSADATFAKGANSVEWQQWCQERFGFDPSVKPPPFDPEKDMANRRASTKNAEWGDDHSRKDLAFDARVQGKWFEQELHRSYAGSAVVQRPEPPHDAMQVPLFRCAATGQLCTRDAFDIDHQIAFESLLKELPKHAQDGRLSKADVLDAYNDTSNLRLVSRAANASHEWEIGRHGDYHDAMDEEPERRGEFGRFIGKGAMSDQEAREIADAMREYNQRQRHKIEVWQELESNGVIGFQDPRAAKGAVVQLSDPAHPDHDRFAKVMKRIDELDPKREVLPEDEQRNNLAAALVAESRREKLPGIQEVDKGGPDGNLLFAACNGPGGWDRAQMDVTRGAMTPMAFSTAETDRLREQMQQAAIQGPVHQATFQK